VLLILKFSIQSNDMFFQTLLNT